jgi:phospholipase A1
MRCKAVSLLPLLSLILLSPVRAEVVTAVSPPQAAVVPGAAAPVDVFFLNTGAAATGVDLPVAIPCRLTAGGRTHDATLRRTSAAPARGTILAAGAFARATYALQVPPGVAAGPAVLELDRPGAPRTVLLVQAPAEVEVKRSANGAALPGVAGGNRNEPVAPTAKRGDSGIAQWVPGRFSGHEPIYFIYGTDQPNVKFQVSFKYQVLNPEGSLVQALPALGGVHLAYSQTSFWDLEGESKPFFDNSYRPEVLWSADDLRLEATPSVVSRLGLQVGLQHESNGRAGDDSRSMNTVYVRPTLTFGDADGDGLFLTVAPKLFAYVGDVDDNPDIKDYRGYGELRTVVGWQEGLQLSTLARLGDDWDKGSLQFDLSCPLRELSGRNADLYLHAQYFNGFGESLLNYNESTSVFRLGVSLVR